MTFIESLITVLIILGAGTLLQAALSTERLLWRLREHRYRRSWQILLLLMILFLIGYTATLGAVLTGGQNLLIVITGAVLFLGALFVNIVVRVSHLTANELLETTTSKQVAHTIIKSMTNSLIILTHQARVKSVNQATCELLGYREQQLMHKPINAILVENELFQGLNLKKLVQTGRFEQVEKTYLSKDGSHIPVLFTCSAINNAEGNLHGFVCIAEDISQRKRHKTALRETQERFQILSETATDGIAILDYEGKIIFANPALAKILGYSADELIGRPVDLIVSKRAVSEHYASLREYLTDDQTRIPWYAVEMSGQHKHGQEVLLEVSLSEFDSQGKCYFSAVFRDITERKQAEEALRHSEERLRAANEELNAFVYIVSHDIQAPLRAIRNYADFLYEDLTETLEGKPKKYFNGLTQAVCEAEEMVRDLLVLSKIGSQDISLREIDMKAVLTRLIDSLNLPPDVELVREDVWPTLNAEPTLIRQIFQNLILNAIKFNQAHPKKVELGWNSTEAGYELFVRDNGIGIEPDYHQQIFGVFQRLHTRSEYEGTGIGLAIVKKALVKLGGNVRVESEPGLGSTFFVTLPISQNGIDNILDDPEAGKHYDNTT